VAAQAEVTPQTLRYYERRGLLPAPVRSPAGSRAYQAAAVRRVRFIKGAQALGFTLADVESLLDLAGMAFAGLGARMRPVLGPRPDGHPAGGPGRARRRR
jgi:DNA-binding transcriptional MerR regulator